VTVRLEVFVAITMLAAALTVAAPYLPFDLVKEATLAVNGVQQRWGR
jgi:hypothetical protein